MSTLRTYVKPTSDLFIRYLLGSEKNKDVLLDFINSFLEDEGFTLAVKLEIKNPFNLKELPEAKESVLDVKAQDAKGRLFDVEIQVIGNEYFIKRALYYWAKLYESRLSDGELYHTLNPVITMNVLEFTIFPEITDAHTCFMATEIEEKDYILTGDMQLHFLELEKVRFEGKPELKSSLDRWIYYLKNEGKAEEEEEMKILLNDDPIMEKAHKTYREFTADEKLVELNEARMKFIRDQKTLIYGARERGIKEGIEQGKERGKKEDVKRMLIKGYHVREISDITGLSVEEIEKLKE